MANELSLITAKGKAIYDFALWHLLNYSSLLYTSLSLVPF